MNAPFSIPCVKKSEQIEAEAVDLSAFEKTRLMMAARIAAGMCANPEIFSQQNWQLDTAVAAMSVADRLIRISIDGGLK